ncbi:MAG: coat protein [Sanya totivirus 5]|nr:MAG: coat protein [Sanya totivirus 5]
MDDFTKTFFPGYTAPHIPFRIDKDGVAMTYAESRLRVDDGDVPRHRHFKIRQPLTALGRVTVEFQGITTSFDGINRECLTPEGAINIDAIIAKLKTNTGMMPNVIGAHIARMSSWDWSDNHVPLLVNMIRYAILKRFHERRDGDNVCHPLYSDGHIVIDRDQFWPPNYPARWTFETWPGGTDGANYPAIDTGLVDHPTVDVPFIDLRGMETSHANFVIMMTGAWRRRSRLKLDFDTAPLCQVLNVRHSGGIMRAEDWQTGANSPFGSSEQHAPPPMLTSNQAWSAIRNYVAFNRIYEHFSAALYIISALTYDMLPITAEGQAWLRGTWRLTLPRFRSIRGRYAFLLDGQGALISHRALREWDYIGHEMDKLNVCALVFCQAIQTGMSVISHKARTARTDKYDSWSTWKKLPIGERLSAWAAEATKIKTPLPSMAGIVFTFDLPFDRMFDDLYVKVLTAMTGAHEHYDLLEKTRHTHENAQLRIKFRSNR